MLAINLCFSLPYSTPLITRTALITTSPNVFLDPYVYPRETSDLVQNPDDHGTELNDPQAAVPTYLHYPVVNFSNLPSFECLLVLP